MPSENIGKIKRVPLRNVWKKEAKEDFQRKKKKRQAMRKDPLISIMQRSGQTFLSTASIIKTYTLPM